MAKAKRKTLPKNFEELLRANDRDMVKAVFDTCLIDARGGYSKQSALAFAECDDALTHWLIDQGADLEATDSYGETPLHKRAGHWRGSIDILLDRGADIHVRDSRGDTPLHKAARVHNLKAAQLLLSNGAAVDALNNAGHTPLEKALRECSNAKLETMADMADLLVSRQPPSEKPKSGFFQRLLGKRHPSQGPDYSKIITQLGETFEFHRASFNPDSVNPASEALDRLYALFNVPPVPRRVLHDDQTPITVSAQSWQDQHQELWLLLVPSIGAARTVQGEAIRISGRLTIELNENGGINWDRDYVKMADALLGYFGMGNALSDKEMAEAKQLVAAAKRRNGEISGLCRLAVNWTLQNPTPMLAGQPDYNR